ncbi:SYF2 splicing factor-domain-containing protein [Syncephalis pseudoplumigaleata]|uniref:Pre-mRNA-splicing factor SYF2 n=1 Tax=Syncephalis pseudoplumigaleata TaxID=1712513 RepID=A0A4P9Z0M1_9FUNG|nr:SYF2 splicing factor-domain-containing protein [Syncephalis pseudoplumigaleata]|eukprot:RKP26013.1 SYF2 splicing factor-domain-containing protein [Syncephalis pseudoplumigaleata]
MEERLKKLQELRERQTKSKQDNRKDVMLEFQRSKENPKLEARVARQKEEARKLTERQEAEEQGRDYLRERCWDWSVEDVEQWNEKQAEKAKRADIAFTDHNQMAVKKYQKMIKELKPDIAGYQEQMLRTALSKDGTHVVRSAEECYLHANSLDYASVDNKPSEAAIDRLVADVNKQIEKRAKFSKRRTQRDDEDVTYINDTNKKFNRMVSRAYDKYTSEIQENLERGTAL